MKNLEERVWESAKMKMAVFIISALISLMLWLISLYGGVKIVTDVFGLLCGIVCTVCGFVCCYIGITAGTKFPKLYLATFGYMGFFALDMTAHLVGSWFGWDFDYYFTVYCLLLNITLMGSLAIAEILDEIN